MDLEKLQTATKLSKKINSLKQASIRVSGNNEIYVNESNHYNDFTNIPLSETNRLKFINIINDEIEQLECEFKSL